MHPPYTIRRFGIHEAKRIGDRLDVSWNRFDVEQFRMGLNIELATTSLDPVTSPPDETPMATARIALNHLEEVPDYYTQLAAMVCSPLRAFHVFRSLLL